ncbi:nuclear pore complex protein Nup205 [Klebsormidium nitens]|uniref:Nuclear pore complex protein Nup205 n=1 Tax=Klebsormidium nitens TaxID=105231 RepID=A0A1Y1I0B3_KLENI|nr:nuclear pore complex protein Nup205 [Klebsormidium nitens]|eukprot:GAQ82869.1 nuclear pore complex protein Nup205 [Klebsormidium nitens]
MPSYRDLLQVVEVAVSGAELQPEERGQLEIALRQHQQTFRDLLNYPPPRPEDRKHVQSRDVRLPNAPPTLLDEQDVQIALKLSDDFNLNELDCVELLIACHQEKDITGRSPLEILRLAAGIYLEERRSLISALHLLLKGWAYNMVAPRLAQDLFDYLKDLMGAGLRTRIVELIKGLSREEPAGMGNASCEPYVADLRGSLVPRAWAVQKERMLLSECLVYASLVTRITPDECSKLFDLVQHTAQDYARRPDGVTLYMAYTATFTLVNTLMSDSATSSDERPAVLMTDAAFIGSFQNKIAASHVAAVEPWAAIVRLAWAVFLLNAASKGGSGVANAKLASDVRAWLDKAVEQNVFHFLVYKVLRTPTFKNDDEDVKRVHFTYLRRLVTDLLRHEAGRELVQDLKDQAYAAPPPDLSESGALVPMTPGGSVPVAQAADRPQAPFLALMELTGIVFGVPPDLVIDEQDVLNPTVLGFVEFAGEDHRGWHTLEAFLDMLAALATGEDGARKVYELLQNGPFRIARWASLFSSLLEYDRRFREALQSTGEEPPFPPGDARALEAYCRVLRKVVQEGAPAERAQWFPDIEPLFRLLPFENVPLRLKAALRRAIAAFVPVSQATRDRIFALLDAYDIPLVAPPVPLSTTPGAPLPGQAYDMVYELNEVEARDELYPSTLSYLELLNALIAADPDAPDQGRRYSTYFRFLRDHVFGPYAQRGYSDPEEKWRIAVASLSHFESMLRVYHPSDADQAYASEQRQGQPSEGEALGTSDAAKAPPPGIEIMKDLMQGRVIFRNLLALLMSGVDSVKDQRESLAYGELVEEAVRLALSVLVLAMGKDAALAELWRPGYKSIDQILSFDLRQVVALLEYVRYEDNVDIQQTSLRLMTTLSERVAQLAPIIMESGAAPQLIEDFALCLEAAANQPEAPENPEEDSVFLILKILISNLDRPAPNVTHLLLGFDCEHSVERSYLNPVRVHSSLRVLLDHLLNLPRLEENPRLYEFGFQLMYELAVDPVVRGPVIELLGRPKYEFFSKHLSALVSEPLPKRTAYHALRVSSLQQRAWLLKLAALELHVADADVQQQKEGCRRLLGRLFRKGPYGTEEEEDGGNVLALPAAEIEAINVEVQTRKVLEIFDVVLFQLPEPSPGDLSPGVQSMRDELKVEELLESDASVEEGGVVRFSERGDRLLDIAALSDALMQGYKRLESYLNLQAGSSTQEELKEAVQATLRWAWKQNQYVEERSAQLHMLTGWQQLVEIAISRRFPLLPQAGGAAPGVLQELLDATLSAAGAPDCPVQLAYPICQVATSVMAKLQEHSMTSAVWGDTSDEVTYADLLSTVRLPPRTCHALLKKLLTVILRPDTSELLKRRLYTTLLSFLQYSRGVANREVPSSVMKVLLPEDGSSDEAADVERIQREQNELMQGNYAVLRNEATALVDVVARDALQGSEVGRALAFYVLEALIALDTQQAFLSQLQSRGLLQNCLSDVANNAYQLVILPSPDSVRKLYTMEAQISLLLRVAHHNSPRGAQALFSMGALNHLASSRALDVQIPDGPEDGPGRNPAVPMPSQRERLHQVLAPSLRLVTSIVTALPKSEDVRAEAGEFVRQHAATLVRIVESADLEELQLATWLVGRIWPSMSTDRDPFKAPMFIRSIDFFCLDAVSQNKYVRRLQAVRKSAGPEGIIAPREHGELRRLRHGVLQVRNNLLTYLKGIVDRSGERFHCFRSDGENGISRAPTLALIADVLEQSTSDVFAATQEGHQLLNKVSEVNDTSRAELLKVIETYGTHEYDARGDSARKRRHVALVEMAAAAASKGRQVSLLVSIIEHGLEIIYKHFQDSRPGSTEPQVGSPDDLRRLGRHLLPTLQKLETLQEDRLGQSPQFIHRLGQWIKSQLLVETERAGSR